MKRNRITMLVSDSHAKSEGKWADANQEQVEVARVVMDILTFSPNPKQALIDWAKEQG